MMKQASRKALASLLLTGILALCAVAAPANDKPLLMEGKKSLYQRVLSVPDARLHEQADETSPATDIDPFSVLYVYEKDGEWLKVGYDSFGGIAGWVRRDRAIVWNQALTVSIM